MAGDPQWADGRSTWRQILKNWRSGIGGSKLSAFKVCISYVWWRHLCLNNLYILCIPMYAAKPNIPGVFWSKICDDSIKKNANLIEHMWYLYLLPPSSLTPQLVLAWLKTSTAMLLGPATRGDLLAFNFHEYDDYGRKGTSSLYVLCIFVWNLVFFFFFFWYSSN